MTECAVEASSSQKTWDRQLDDQGEPGSQAVRTCVCPEILTERDQFTDKHACSLLASFSGQAAKKSNITMIIGEREKK